MKSENIIITEPVDHLAQLISSKKESNEAFLSTFLSLSNVDRAKVIVELPDTYEKELLGMLNDNKIAKFVNLMRTDDATDLMIMLKSLDEVKWLRTIENLDTKLTEAVKLLMDYSEE